MAIKPSDTKGTILASARILFWKHGFRRVSVEEICEKSQISKMTFYRYFPNKIELAKTVFLKVAEEAYLRFQEILTSGISPDEKISRILLLKFEGTVDISEEFLRDFYSETEELSNFIKSSTYEIWQRIIGDFRNAQEKGIFRKDVNFDFFFLISRKIIDSLNDPDMQILFASPQEMIMETARLLMYGIAPEKK